MGKPLRELTWHTLQPAVMAMTTEAEVQAAIDEERAGANRPLFLRRLGSRWRKLRAIREREEVDG